MSLNVSTILTALHIDYEPQSEKAVGVRCPFCSDNKRHCGVFLDHGNYYCFRCGRKGNLFTLLRAIANITYYEFKTLTRTDIPQGKQTVVDRIRETFTATPVASTLTKQAAVTLPGIPITEQTDNPVLLAWLAKKHITIQTCIDYSARITGRMGEYANRLILPIWDEYYRVATWQARDITGQARTKYLSRHGVPINQFLYWTDVQVGEPIYLVEGIFDVWRMDRNAVASFGRNLSSKQRILLASNDTITDNGLVIAWDGDAWREANKLVNELACIIDHIGLVRLPDGTDPDSLGARQVRMLRIQWL